MSASRRSHAPVRHLEGAEATCRDADRSERLAARATRCWCSATSEPADAAPSLPPWSRARTGRQARGERSRVASGRRPPRRGGAAAGGRRHRRVPRSPTPRTCWRPRRRFAPDIVVSNELLFGVMARRSAAAKLALFTTNVWSFPTRSPAAVRHRASPRETRRPSARRHGAQRHAHAVRRRTPALNAARGRWDCRRWPTADSCAPPTWCCWG
jgi:hypothetical protein